MQTYMAEWTSLMHEAFTGNRIIKAYNLEETVVQQFKATARRYVNQMMRVVRANEIPGQLSELLGGLGVALVLLYGVFFMERSPDMAGDFVGFILGIVIMYQPIKALTRLHNSDQSGAASSQRVFELLDTMNTVTDPASPKPLNAAEADIHFHDIDFHYGDRPVLRGVNLTVKAGRWWRSWERADPAKPRLLFAITVLRSTGRIGADRLNGHPGSQTERLEERIAWLRRRLSSSTIPFTTISPSVDRGFPVRKLRRPARHAHAHEFIMERPEKYETTGG
jgi:subfamily B ATP-binding cassette protein MsbA